MCGNTSSATGSRHNVATGQFHALIAYTGSMCATSRQVGFWLVAAFLAGLGGCERPPQRPTLPDSAPNVLLISIDTLRSDHLHCYGYAPDTSPNIDQLAAEGTLFENHISSTSWTLPAHAALFTSLSDSVHKCQDTPQRLSDDHVTLAERFYAAGYTTVGFFSGPYLHPAFGLGQGFETYEDCSQQAARLAGANVNSWAMDKDVMRTSHEDITGPRLYEAFHTWLAAHRGQKFFMFIHMWDPHFDFIPPPPYDQKFDPDYTGTVTGRNFFFDPNINANMPARDLEHLRALYDGEIAFTDEYVGKIIGALREAGLLDDTIVAVTADHGTEFFEHGLKGHRQTLFDEVLHIPLIIRYPDDMPAGVRVKLQTRMVDTGVTLLDLAGVKFDPQTVMGDSLRPIANGQRLDFDNTAISELNWAPSPRARFDQRTVRTPALKFYHNLARNQQYYYDLLADPGEQNPLWDLTHGVGQKLYESYGRVLTYLDKCRAIIKFREQHANISDSMRANLGSFGYVGDNAPQPHVLTTQPATAPATKPSVPTTQGAAPPG